MNTASGIDRASSPAPFPPPGAGPRHEPGRPRRERQGHAARTIKILHVIKTLDLGGAEANLYNLVRATDREKFEIHVAYSSGGEIEKKMASAGVALFKYARGNHKVQSAATVLIVWRIFCYILKNGIQIVHTHNFSAHIWGALAAKAAGRKIVEHVHDSRYLDREEFSRRREVLSKQYRYVRWLKGISDRVLVLTRQNQEFIIQHNLYKADRVVEIKNGIPIISRDTPRTRLKEDIGGRLGFTPDAGIVLTSARMSAGKNIDLIFRMVPRVAQEVPGVVFILCGNGPLFEHFDALRRRDGLEARIKMVGYCPEIYDFLGISDVFLLPTLMELHSLAILESMSMGVPVVTSKGVGSHDEFIVSGENGILLDPFCDAGWAEAVVGLLKDPPLRRRIGENGYQTCVRQFDIRDTAKKMEGIYAGLIGS